MKGVVRPQHAPTAKKLRTHRQIGGEAGAVVTGPSGSIVEVVVTVYQDIQVCCCTCAVLQSGFRVRTACVAAERPVRSLNLEGIPKAAVRYRRPCPSVERVKVGVARSSNDVISRASKYLSCLLYVVAVV
jgi:hypothetical protein